MSIASNLKRIALTAAVTSLAFGMALAEKVPSEIEVRGLEVLSTGAGFQDSVQIGELLQRIDAGEFNQLYPEVRTLVGLAYRSELETPMPFLRADVGNPFSTLRSSLPADVELHPWVHVMPAHNALMGKNPMPKSPLGVAPAMANLNVRGEKESSGSVISLDPGHPGTREYLVALFIDIIKSTRPTGVVLDDMWYPGSDWGYSEGAIQAFRAAVGGSGAPPADDPTWCAWRRAQLTETLRHLRTRVREVFPTMVFTVVVDADGPPPATWEEWLNSPTYTERMQDWVGWAQEGLVDQVMVRYFKRQDAENLRELELWARFMNNNSVAAKPIISLSGKLNFTDSLMQQYRIVRGRGIGTALYHYDSPTRDQNAGFFNTLPINVYSGRPGLRLPAAPLTGVAENRQFAVMAVPPPTIVIEKATVPTPTPEPPIRFTRPTPIPSPTPEASFKPTPVVRTIMLRSGRQIQAKVLEVRGEGVVIQLERGGSMELRKKDIEKVVPPIPEVGL